MKFWVENFWDGIKVFRNKWGEGSLVGVESL